MAAQIIDKLYQNYDQSLNLPLNSIFVIKRINGEDKVYSLDKLFIQTTITKKINGVQTTTKVRKHLSTFKEFADNVAKGVIYNSANVGELINARDTLLYKPTTLELPNVIVSTSIAPNMIMTSNNVTVKVNGYNKFLEPVADTVLDYKAYFAIKLRFSNEVEFLKLEDVYYYEGSNRISLKNKTVDEIKTIVQTKDLFNATGITIDTLYLEKSFKFNLKAQDYTFEQNSQTLVKTHQLTTDDAGNIKIIETDQVINDYVVEHTPVNIPMEVEMGQVENRDMVEVKRYNRDQNGNYINIVFEGVSSRKMIKIDDLYSLDAVPQQITDLSAYLGKSVQVKVGDKFIKTKPLTEDQINNKYSIRLRYTPSRSTTEDAMSDKSFLLLRNGAHKKEKDVAKAKYYKIAADNATDYDAYLIYAINAAGQKTEIIVSKEYYEEQKAKHNTISFTLDPDGYQIANSATDVKKIVRTNDVTTCDVYQTTSVKDGKIEHCKVLSTNTEERTQELNVLDQAFESAYKKGDYLLTSVYDGDNLVDVDNRYPRYIESEATYVENHGANIVDSLALKANPYIYESTNGELGKITGGPKYQTGKAIGEAYKVWGKVFGSAFALSMDPAGMLMMMAFFPVTIAATAGLLVTLPGIPIWHGIKGLAKNTFKFHTFKDLNNINQKQWRKELVAELQHLNTETLDKNKTQTEEFFFTECANIDDYIATLTDKRVDNGFEMVNGKLEINKSNIRSASKFIAENKQMQKDINAITKKRDKVQANITALEKKQQKLQKKNKDLSQEELQKLEKAKRDKVILDNEIKTKTTTLKTRMINYRGEPDFVEVDNKSKTLIEKGEKLKAFLYIKKFKNTEYGSNLDWDQFTYDFEKDVFKYKGQELSKIAKKIKDLDKKINKTKDLGKKAKLEQSRNELQDILSNLKLVKGVVETADSDIRKTIKNKSVVGPAIVPPASTSEVEDELTDENVDELTDEHVNNVTNEHVEERNVDRTEGIGQSRTDNDIVMIPLTGDPEQDKIIEEINKRNQQLKKLRDLDKALDDVVRLNSEISSLEKAIKTRDKAIQTLTEELEKEKKKKPRYKTQKQEQQQKIKDLEEKLKKLQDEKTQQEEANKTKLEQLKAERDEIKAELKRTYLSFKNAQQELENLKKNKELNERKINALTKKLEKLQQEASRDIEWYKNNKAELENQIKDLKAKIKAKDELISSSLAAEEKAKLEQEKQELNNKLTEALNKQKELLAELNKQKGLIARLTEENAEKDKTIEKLKDLETQYNSLKSDKEKLEKEREKLKKQLESAEKSKKEEIEKLTKAIAAKNAEIEKCIKDLKTLKEDFEKLKTNNKELQSEIADLKKQLETINSEKEKLQEDLKKLETTKNAEIAKLQEQIAEKDKQIKSLNEKIKQIEKTIIALQAANLQLNKDNEDLRDANARINEELTDANKEIERLKQQLQEQEGIKAKYRESMKNIDNSLVVISSKIDDVVKEIKNKEKQHKSILDKLNTKPLDVKAVNKEIAKHNSEVLVLSKEVSALKAKLAEYDERAKSLFTIWELASTEEGKKVLKECATRVEKVKTLNNRINKVNVDNLIISKLTEEKEVGAEYNTKINSEDRLVVLLKATAESKDRKRLLEYISKKAGVEISDADIKATIKRINDKHNPKTGEPKPATAGAASLKNANINIILTYGQEYLTKYAQQIKQRTGESGLGV